MPTQPETVTLIQRWMADNHVQLIGTDQPTYAMDARVVIGRLVDELRLEIPPVFLAELEPGALPGQFAVDVATLCEQVRRVLEAAFVLIVGVPGDDGQSALTAAPDATQAIVADELERLATVVRDASLPNV